MATADSTTVVASTSVINEIVVGTAETLAATDEMLVFTGGTFADNAALLASVVTGGTNVVTSAGNWVALDTIIAVYSDGTDAHVVGISETTGGATAWAAGDATVIDLVTLSGISSITAGDFVNANFEFVA